MTFWFLILLIAGIGMTLHVIVLIAAMEEPIINPTERDILFSIFFILMAKASAETSEDTMRNSSLKHYFASPVKNCHLVFSRLLKVFWYNLALVAVVMGLVGLMVRFQGMELPAGGDFYVRLYGVVILAPLVGFNVAVFTHQDGMKRKLMFLLPYGQIIGLLWLSLHPSLGTNTRLLYIAAMALYSVSVTYVISDAFKEGWASSVKSRDGSIFSFHSRRDFLPKALPAPVRKIAQGEILRRWRNRQIPATLGVTVLLAAGLVFIYRQLGPNPDIGLDLGKYFYPALIGISIYTTVVVHSVIPSLTLFSRDGSRLWSLRTAPVDPYWVVTGKACSTLLFAPITSALVVLPASLALGYPVSFVLFAYIASMTMYFLFTGMGVLMGILFPNFDESNRGAPDVMTMYIVLMMCLFAGAFFLGLPTAILERDRFLGIMACILSADLAALAMVIMFRYGGKRYGEMEINM